MEHTQNLFQEFDAVTTEEWLKAIERFLKGKPVDSLNWEIEEDLVVSPLNRADNTTNQYIGSANLAINNNWNICEAFVLTKDTDYPSANKLILDALSKGVNALILQFEHLPTLSELSTLLQDVLLDLVHIHFQGTALINQPTAFLEQLSSIPTIHQLHGSCDLGVQPTDAFITLMEAFSTSLPHIRLVNITIPQATSQCLAQGIYEASLWINFLVNKGQDFEQISNLLRFEFNVGEQYFVELACIRAFKRLWLGLLEAYEAPKAFSPFLHASTQSDQHENQYWNMITATTQAMAAAIAGIDSIYVRPCSGLEQADSFTRRIARNVQHLLQSESYLNRVIDPASGAYYIENLTTALAKKAWQQFCTL